MKPLQVEVDDELARRLERLAPARSRRRSEFVRAAILKALWEAEEPATAEAYARQPDSPDTTFDPADWEAAVLRANRPSSSRVAATSPAAEAFCGCGLRYLNKAIVAEVTTTLRGIPRELPMGEPEGLVLSVANFDNISTSLRSTRTRSEASARVRARLGGAQDAVILPGSSLAGSTRGKDGLPWVESGPSLADSDETKQPSSPHLAIWPC